MLEWSGLAVGGMVGGGEGGILSRRKMMGNHND